MMRFDELIIENFRGAVSPLRLSFSRDKPITVIFGENGTGKTTIVGAIDLVANGSVGSIREKSSTTISAHSPTMGKTAGDIRVAVTSRAGTWTGSIKSSKVIVEPTPGPRVRILRRTNLQRFIESKPADRYWELRHLLAVDLVEKSEQALSNAANYAANTANQFARDRESALEMLVGIWRSEGALEADAVTWAESELARDLAEVEFQELGFRNTAEALRALRVAEREYHDAVASRDAIAAGLRSVMQEMASVEGIGVEQSIDLTRLLQSVQKLIGIGTLSGTCPVCEQPIVADDLATQVADRLQGLDAFRQLDTQRITWQHKQESAEERVRKRTRLLVETAVRIVAIANGDLPDCAPIALLPKNHENLQPGDVELALRVSADAANLLEEVERKRDDLSRRSGRVSSLTQALSSIREAEEETGRAVQRQEALKGVLDIVRATRHQFSHELLKGVADETNDLYERIHPGEGLAISKLELDPKQRASLHQGVTFGGRRDVPPQAYLSEAHLDTLGFCFWLAVAKSDPRREHLVLVIDDVFSSVDADHLERIVDVLFEEAGHFAQVIVTTHHRNLRARMLGVRGASNKVQPVDLGSFWSFERGITCHVDDLALSDLQRVIDHRSFDRQQAASRAGIALERVLDTLALRYQLPMPRNRRNEYTLQPLLNAVGSKLSKQIVVISSQYPEGKGINDIYQRIVQCQFIRNQVGAHHNDEGGDVSDRSVLEFARLTLELIETVTCSHCVQLPAKDDGGQYRCTCPEPHRTFMRPMKV